MNVKNESRVAELLGTSGCATIVVASPAALLLYPHAIWLFALAIVGIAILAIAIRLRKDPSPCQIADAAERILNGLSQGWDVDDYEHLNPREARVRELWSQTMGIRIAGGMAAFG
jgi:hypothetical protein